jgi:DNA (cytosine-5)-methyltransferase 1
VNVASQTIKTRSRKPIVAEEAVESFSSSERPLLSAAYLENPEEWWAQELRSQEERGSGRRGQEKVRVLDLFSSVGGLALGARYAAELLGRKTVFEGAVDVDVDALSVHEYNLNTRRIIHESVLDLVDLPILQDRKSGKLRLDKPSMLPLGRGFSDVGLLIGGPPCQGHSTLNNRTRSDDPKNKLMLAMPAVAVALNINSVVIENVPNVINDSGGVVQKTVELFESHGYKVQQGVITARSLGWPQTRKRYFIVARLDKNPLAFESVVETLRMPPQGISWAIDDLLDVKAGSGLMHSTPTLSKENLERIEWLFKNKKYDLENHMRPKCHQDGHTYPAVYGRMKWDEPAPTITGGFQTPGRGRFIHPKRKRVLTPNEAARIQGFPDWFDFESASMNGPTRTMLGKWIGDAVPSMLGAAAVLSAIG